MKKHWSKLLIGITLSLTMITGVLAADPWAMTDIWGHWAEEAIVTVMDQGLFNGVSETEFAPDDLMSRGMFVTVLGRLAGIDPWEYQNWYLDTLYIDVNAEEYYAPYINWATRYGIVNGQGDGSFLPEDPITREQMAAIVMRYASIYNYQIMPVSDEVAPYFVDQWQISDYAVDSVDALRRAGIVTGEYWDDGYHYLPEINATRAECARILTVLEQALEPYWVREIVEPWGLSVTPDTVELQVGDFSTLSAQVYPENATNQTVTWISTDPDVVTVLPGGILRAKGVGEAEIYAYTCNGEGGYYGGGYAYVTVKPNQSLAYAGESFEDKCNRIFGFVVPGGVYGGQWRDVYQSYATGDTSYLTTVAVQVWDFADAAQHEKNTKTIYLDVHQNIAATVEAIFREIYESPERPVINYAGGYYPSDGSEHDPGLAIDINADANYYCSPNGAALVGSHWDPENDPYSIPVNGVIENTFRKYGFTRGIYWRSGYKDYMHFSFFGY